MWGTGQDASCYTGWDDGGLRTPLELDGTPSPTSTRRPSLQLFTLTAIAGRSHGRWDGRASSARLVPVRPRFFAIRMLIGGWRSRRAKAPARDGSIVVGLRFTDAWAVRATDADLARRRAPLVACPPRSGGLWRSALGSTAADSVVPYLPDRRLWRTWVTVITNVATRRRGGRGPGADPVPSPLPFAVALALGRPHTDRKWVVPVERCRMQALWYGGLSMGLGTIPAPPARARRPGLEPVQAATLGLGDRRRQGRSGAGEQPRT